MASRRMAVNSGEAVFKASTFAAWFGVSNPRGSIHNDAAMIGVIVLAMRFRGLLRSGTAEGLDAWLIDARASGINAMQRLAKTIRQDLGAVRNAVSEPWSNGQTEGQINKLKTLKPPIYGRAGVELLRASG
jgi:hypothetical protein